MPRARKYDGTGVEPLSGGFVIGTASAKPDESPAKPPTGTKLSGNCASGFKPEMTTS